MTDIIREVIDAHNETVKYFYLHNNFGEREVKQYKFTVECFENEAKEIIKIARKNGIDVKLHSGTGYINYNN